MGKLRGMMESLLLLSFWCAITTITGCSAEEVIQRCQGTAEIIETSCEIQLPDGLKFQGILSENMKEIME